MSPGPFTRLPGAPSDRRLLASARAGDERAFESLVLRHRRSLLRYCRRMGLSHPRAEDVVQQALLQAWLALGRGREVHAPKAWLYRTVHNTAVNFIRASREDHAPLEDGTRVDSLGSAETAFERRLAVRQALSDVAALPDMQRQAILLTAFDGRSHEEVASALGVTHGAVRGLLYRARASLRDAAAALMPQPLLAWAGSYLGKLAPTASRVAELSGPAGGSEMGGGLAKGVALAATAAALAVGAAVAPVQRHGANRPKTDVVALGIGGGAGSETGDASGATAATGSPAGSAALSGATADHAGPSSGGHHRSVSGSAGRSGTRHAAGGDAEHGLGQHTARERSPDGSAGDGRAGHGGDGHVESDLSRFAGSGHDTAPSSDASGGDRSHLRDSTLPRSDGLDAKSAEKPAVVQAEPEAAPTRDPSGDGAPKSPQAPPREPRD